MSLAVGSPMQKIASWEDVTQFSGKIVAYTTQSSYFEAKSYPINDMFFARIGTVVKEFCNKNKEAEVGYSMDRFLISDATTDWSVCKLAASSLKDEICMRIATKKEALAIEKAILKHEAEFEFFCDQGDQLALVQRHLYLISSPN